MRAVNDHRIVLLGPQEHHPTAGQALDDLGVAGPVATITAGWQEWESHDGALREQLGREVRALGLYGRAERTWSRDPELHEAHRQMQRDFRLLQRLYRRRLELAADAWMELLGVEGDERIVEPERMAAVEAIQTLDERHLQRMAEIRADFDHRLRPLERESVARERDEIAAILGSVPAVVIEGGHLAVLLNRLLMFGVPELLTQDVLVGCSGGAMLLCERALLYQDAPAIGRGHAEVGLPGLGFVPGLAALPDARARLRLDDPARMSRLAVRVAPLRCAVLDPGERLVWDGTTLEASGSRTVAPDGMLTAWEDAA